MTVASRVVTRFADGFVRAYEFSDDSPVGPVAEFPVAGDAEVESHAVAPGPDHAVYATAEAVVCLDRAGRTLWRLGIEPKGPQSFRAVTNCAFSLDGTVVWVYLPDAMARRGPDRWLAVDSGSGRVLAETELDCAGHGGRQFVHPDGVHMLLDVGEGQDGARVYRGRLGEDGIEPTSYPWTDRALVSLAPDGRHFMTVDHGQGDVAFHAYPEGEVMVRVPVEDFGHEPDEMYLEWTGGYLDSVTAIVAFSGEDENARERHEHHLVDVRTGRVQGMFDARARSAYDVEPLGDGSWLSTGGDGGPVRHVR